MKHNMGSNNHGHYMLSIFLFCLVFGGNDHFDQGMVKGVEGLAVNWGTQSTHLLQPNIAVRMMKDNGFDKVKLFEAHPGAMQALGHSGIQVMVGIPNEFLASLATSVQFAVNWVQQNVSSYISRYGTDIRYVAVGNEPFLKSYKDMFVTATFPALQNIQAALIKAGLGKQVKVTVPINADVYQTASGVPSGGDFRSDIRDRVINIVKFLSDSNSPLTINIYPFLSLQADPSFPRDYAFFDGAATPVVDGSIQYTNVLEANFDTLIAALEKNGFGSMPIIIGEVGWPTDGDPNANVDNARRFNQGLLNRIFQGKGTPRRKTPPDIYLFSFMDEDAKSTKPGNFERHWGMFYFDGTVKYKLDIGNGKSLVPAKGVRYLAKQWCIMSPDASPSDPSLPNSISYACSYADCTSLGYGSSCGTLDAKSNASYAFNMYYQTMNQTQGACSFNNLSVVTRVDPSQGSCRFEIMIDTAYRPKKSSSSPSGAASTKISIAALSVILILSFMSA